MPPLSQGHLLIYSGKPEEFRNRLFGAAFLRLEMPRGKEPGTGCINRVFKGTPLQPAEKLIGEARRVRARLQSCRKSRNIDVGFSP
jgi:hypothetical protein